MKRIANLSCHRALAILLLLPAILISNQAGDAKLGLPIKAFEATLPKEYKSMGQSTNKDRTYHKYVKNFNDKMLASVPGFAVGMTITVDRGTIIGQSMIIRPGTNAKTGRTMAAAHALDMAYEALGKSFTTKEAAKKELSAYEMAIDKALSGTPQVIRYPGKTAKITISKTADGDIVMAVTAS